MNPGLELLVVLPPAPLLELLVDEPPLAVEEDEEVVVVLVDVSDDEVDVVEDEDDDEDEDEDELLIEAVRFEKWLNATKTVAFPFACVFCFTRYAEFPLPIADWRSLYEDACAAAFPLTVTWRLFVDPTAAFETDVITTVPWWVVRSTVTFTVDDPDCAADTVVLFAYEITSAFAFDAPVTYTSPVAFPDAIRLSACWSACVFPFGYDRRTTRPFDPIIPETFP